MGREILECLELRKKMEEIFRADELEVGITRQPEEVFQREVSRDIKKGPMQGYGPYISDV